MLFCFTTTPAQNWEMSWCSSTRVWCDWTNPSLLIVEDRETYSKVVTSSYMSSLRRVLRENEWFYFIIFLSWKSLKHWQVGNPKLVNLQASRISTDDNNHRVWLPNIQMTEALCKSICSKLKSSQNSSDVVTTTYKQNTSNTHFHRHVWFGPSASTPFNPQTS